MQKFNFQILICLLTIVLFSCKRDASDQIDDFNGYISNYTAEPISACGEISVQLSFAPDTAKIKGINWDNILNLKPTISSKAYYDANRNAVIIKSPNLAHNQKYVAKFNLGALTEVPNGLQYFEMPIERKVQVWNFHASHPEIKSMDQVEYKGHVSYVDCEPDKSLIEKGLSAEQGNQNLNIIWKHSTKENKSEYTIQNIKRTDQQEQIKIKLSMFAIGEDESATHELIIPSKADFSYMRHVIRDNDQMSIYFSDPLQKNQNIEGLLKVKGRKILKTNIEFNRIDLYFDNNKYGYYDLEILPGIKNQGGFPFKDKAEHQLFFKPPMPSVKFAEKGHILPPNNSWKVPIKIVSTSGFRLRLLKVYERNVHQYFQNNRHELSQQSGLDKVGRIVLDTIYTLKDDDLFNESVHMIDLTTQVEREPQALYKLFLTIPTELNAYPCKDPIVAEQKDRVDRINFDQSYSVYYDEYDYYYAGNMSFNDRPSSNPEYDASPCTSNYFNTILDQRILMCTDVGLVLKYEPEKQRYFAYTSNISDAQALSNARVTLYDYQGNELVSGRSNSDGMVSLNTKALPFLVKAVAPSGQAVYMHVSDDKALSLSTFQVEGKNWGSKSKLFFYGERDVWRPGDSTYLQCIYYDEKNTLPNKFPIHAQLIDPRGRINQEWQVTDHKLGLFDIRFKTDMNAATGLWKMEVKIGNEKHNHPIRIETIRPNRLKFNLDFAAEDILKVDDAKNAALQVKWMHGLEAADLTTEISMKQISMQNPFGEYFENYTFNDLYKSYNAEKGMIKSQKSDNQGTIKFDIPLEENNTYPSQMRLNFRLRSFEKGGAFSSDVKSIKLSPYTEYVGVKWPGNNTGNNFILESGKNIQIACVDEDGNRISGEVIVTTYHITNSWWYQYGNNGLNYAAIKNQFEAQSSKQTIRVNKEGKSYALTGNGRKLVHIESIKSGHSVSRQMYVYDPNDNNTSGEEMDQVEVLPFLVEPSKYQVGDLLSFDLPPASKGKYLVTIENGGSILHKEVHASNPRSPVTVSIGIEERMVPNAYVYVHYIASYDMHTSHRPLRLFGIQAIQVHAPQTILEPEITVGEEIRTDENFTFSVKEKSGKRMAYTIAIVDEGLLDVTQFSTPNPWQHFFSKEALNVKTWDMYRDIFHRFLGEYKSLLAVGGDESGSIPNEAQAQRFKPTVKFKGPFILEAGEVANHTEQISEYVGSVRTMVIATNGKAFGKAQAESKVLKPLMLYSTLPRVLGPGEQLKLPVTVFAMKDYIKNVTVNVKCLNADVFKNGHEQKLLFDKIGEQDLSFDVTTPEKMGVLDFEITATSGSETTTEKIQIDLRPSSAAITTSQSFLTKAGATSDIAFQPFGITGTNSAHVSVSRGLNFSFEPYVDQLSQYPHGCLEQSVSAVFPQIYLNKMNLLTDPQKLSFKQRFKAVIQKLRTLQEGNGGFVYWPGGNQANAWGTSYALQFLIEAKKMGYEVPNKMLDDAIDYQYKAADRWVIPSYSNTRYLGNLDLDQAYRLYTLVLAGKPNYGAMNRLRLVPNLNNTSKWLLAHALTLEGEVDAAALIMKNTNTSVESYRELSHTFGSGVRDQALILRILMEKGEKLQAKKIVDELTPYFTERDKRTLSTQEIAQCMIGFALFVDDLEKIEDGVAFEILKDNKVILDEIAKDKSISLPLGFTNLEEQEIKIKNKGNAELYASLITKGTPARDESPSKYSDLEMVVKYQNADGGNVDFKELAQGQDYTMSIKIKHPGTRMHYDNMALSVIMPPGCEIINTRLQSDINFNEGSKSDYKDIRDDRIYTYFSLSKNETKEFRYLINATYEGRYWVPSVFSEAMYDGEINAKTEGFWTVIKSN